MHLKRKLDHWAGRLQQNTAIKAGQWHAWVKYGKALRLSGKLAAADVAFERAVQEYQGNSPFDLAEIFYERSLGWLAGPEPDHRQARRYLEFAVSYLPGYVDAHLQLARVYLHLHYKGSARTLLEAIKDGPDPRAAAMLAGLYEKAGDDPLAKASLNAAKDKYEKVLETVPYVASDHAVDFFLELGEDPARALELAEMNLRVRPTLVAFEKAIAAAKQAADTTALCRIVDELQNRFPNAKLVGMVACS